MKHIIKILLFLISFLSFFAFFSPANAVTCWPNSWEGNRTVETNCDFPVGYRISGDMYTGPYTVNVSNGTLGVNLSANKITFTTGKIMFYNGKADGSVWSNYAVGVWYGNSGYYPCPGGRPVHPSWSRLLSGGGEWAAVGVGAGYFYCGK